MWTARVEFEIPRFPKSPENRIREQRYPVQKKPVLQECHVLPNGLLIDLLRSFWSWLNKKIDIQ